MSEETFVQLMWVGILVCGFAFALVVLAVLGKAIGRAFSPRRPDWDHTAEFRRRITDRGRATRMGAQQSTRRTL
jgi:hypothetical protein